MALADASRAICTEQAGLPVPAACATVRAHSGWLRLVPGADGSVLAQSKRQVNPQGSIGVVGRIDELGFL